MASIISTTENHLKELILDMREDDKEELKACKLTPEEAVYGSFKLSDYCRTGLSKTGRVSFVWGVSGSGLIGIGNLWMLSTNQVERDSLLDRMALIELAQKELQSLLLVYDRLFGFVYTKYHKACRLLKILGFTVIQSEPFSTYYLEK